MSNALMFDRYRVIRKYREAGLTEAQAEIYAEALVIAVEDQVATKQDLREVEVALRQEIATVRQDMLAMESRLVWRLGGMMAAGIAVLTAIITLIQ